jgi:hypothetical protein
LPLDEVQAQDSKRKFCSKWSVPVQSGRIPVCQGAILAIFDVSYGRLNNLDKMMSQGDRRGKQKATSKNQPIKKAIEEHLASISKHKSHYNRAKCPKKMYIASDGIKTKSDMHRLYQLAHSAQPELQCEYKFYVNVFNGFNVGFLVNSTDECGECLQAKAENKTNTKKHKRHRLHAKLAREQHQEDINNTGERTFVGERDLKSVTDVPKLPHGEMFYKRTLSCYSSIIHDSKEKKAHLFNWTESEASRGTNEMIEVRAKFVEQQKTDHGERKYDHFIFWEDNWSGQNKSSYNQ